MKLSGAFAASSLCCAVFAARPTVTPETARLIIAQRLGLSRFHAIEHADAETIRHINTYGGPQQKLFGIEDAHVSRAHLLVWAEDVEQDEATVIINDGSDRTLDFAISGAPPASDNDRLIMDFIAQAETLPEYPDPQQRTYKTKFDIQSALPSNSKAAAYNGYLNMWRTDKNDKMTPEDMASALANINKKAHESGFAVTVVMMPRARSKSKRTTDPWGTYNMPAKQVNRQNPEAVLSSIPVPAATSKTSDESFPVIATEAENNKGPVRGILPTCFNSMAACQSRTQNCSNHGECKLLHKGRGSGSNQETIDCYGCACSPTIQHVGEDKGMEIKKKVTYWGGPACQKKDISTQFWLFVGSGVILAFLVSSGIGMLYSMGAEELPSVIGAGVSGPTRK
ncbi:hypothetical protein PTNB73_09591 [Pyrenophora teres f. teres]|uniref:DUF3844 multi-domain protein n=1 Tax=Pyrenophora teres f. teres TaxID=97479 RepID=A0A6S6VRD4_9PLEO|nr:hypothetical protein HRS9139_10229 [Pyrenophora teres f. teres]KAE8833008.1 hypothetical protein HRS9122_08721 [Pyrenophora teres f. teres]KAE8852958.1 hypothetical protein PTNB29_10348 [Pyrenophora teres f. teres]KAE8856326.1 hypothetical protein PTNB73_09591 [Pyrenophora teres f. teres]CAE7000418.1 DUF3844 multi-domain protein [Pyrenophora teres f. teres]